MAHIAYLRVSTLDQSTSRQFGNNLDQFDRVFEDKLSGKNLNRPALMECMEVLQSGDTLHIHEISRLSRSLDDLRKTVSGLVSRGVNVKFHKEGLEFSADKSEPMRAAVSQMLLSTLGSIAEFERELISIRVKEALAVKKNQGVKLGAASPKYKANPNNTTKRNREEAVKRCQGLIEPIKLLLRALTNPTYKNLAHELTEGGYPLPSGIFGIWKASQVKRVMDRFELKRVA